MTAVAGIDIGGTKIAAGLVDADGGLLTSASVPTPAREGAAAIIGAAVSLVRSLGGRVVGAGVGSAGVIDAVHGTVLSATDALTGWAGTPLRDLIAEALGVPVAVDNDVHAHAVGEAWLGAARGCSAVLYLAVGTGIGGSILLDGRVWHGARSVAGHAGHLPVPAAAGLTCPCGGTGHVEALSSGPAMVAAYRRASGDPGVAGLPGVAARAAADDAVARRVLASGAAGLGQLIGGLVNMLDPDLVVVGGGVSRSGPHWWDEVLASARDGLLPPVAGVPIVPSALGGNGAILGAARLAWLEGAR